MLPILTLLRSCHRSSVSLVDRLGELPARFGKAGLIDQFPQAASRQILKRWTPPIAQLTDWEWQGAGGFFRLTDGSRREADHEESMIMAHLCEEASRHFSPDLGYGTITRINVIDGVRFYFDSGDIAHIRPSGNAPQLRFYAVADSQQRVNQMVEQALSEPAGLLRSMELEV
jgi:phosphomannomutase